MKSYLTVFLIAIASVFATHDVVYVTYGGDPATSMNVHWKNSKDEGVTNVFYKKKGEYFCHEAKTELIEVKAHEVAYSHAQITGLEEDTLYEFKIGEEEEIFLFRTAPVNLTELKFAVGADAYGNLDLFRRMNKQIVKENPRFIVIGGDIAYSKSHFTGLKLSNPVERWNVFFKEYRKTMVSREGGLIPLVPVVGNHDASKKDHVFYNAVFAIPSGFSYQALNFGDYLTLLCMDTGHISPIEGVQTEWLETVLKAKNKVPYLFAVYHVAAYPSYYDYGGYVPCQIRRNWVPLFEEGGVQVAFEGHNHTYKRTFLLKNGEIDDTGILYLGDGAWGVKPRKPRCENSWYLEEGHRLNNFFLVTLNKEFCEIEPIGIDGELIDDPQLIFPKSND